MTNKLKKGFVSFSLCLCMIITFSISSFATADKTYYCEKADEPVVIDGNLNEWGQASEINLSDTATGATPVLGTKVKMMWNDEYLYVAFNCQDNYIHATYTNYNDPLYQEEAVEVFIDPDCDLKTYTELEVNPLNALFHYYIENDLNGSFFGYQKGFKCVNTAVNKNDSENFWTVEMAIPLKEVVTSSGILPKAGDKWLINLYRIDRPQNGQDEYTAWSPTGAIAFHVPQKFGQLIFVE